MSTIFRQSYFPWVHKKKLGLYVLPGKKIRTQKKKLVGVPNCFVAVIEHPMTMIGIQPMLHELAHILAFFQSLSYPPRSLHPQAICLRMEQDFFKLLKGV